MNKSVFVTLGMNAAGYLAGAKSAHQATLDLALDPDAFARFQALYGR